LSIYEVDHDTLDMLKPNQGRKRITTDAQLRNYFIRSKDQSLTPTHLYVWSELGTKHISPDEAPEELLPSFKLN
jgi:hypothetical protein